MEQLVDAVGLATQVAVLNGGVVSVEDIQLPPRGAGEIDVEITSAAICGSDLHTVLGHRSSPPSTALGHEGVGRITAVDAGVRDLRGTELQVGDRVLFALFSACGVCDRCEDGLPMKCRSLVKYGHESSLVPPHATGTLATHVRLLPGVPVVTIPDTIDDVQVVSAGCAVATAVAIVAAAGPVSAGTNVVVFGAGAVGAYCTAMFASMGCSVRVKDPSASRLALVEQLGAETDGPPPAPASVVVEASGNPDAFVEAVETADLGGRVVAAGSVSLGNTSITIDPALVVTRRLRIIGVHNYTADDFLWGVDWLLEHGPRLGLERLLSPALTLSEVGEGFEEMRSGRFPRVLVQPQPQEQLHEVQT